MCLCLSVCSNVSKGDHDYNYQSDLILFLQIRSCDSQFLAQGRDVQHTRYDTGWKTPKPTPTRMTGSRYPTFCPSYLLELVLIIPVLSYASLLFLSLSSFLFSFYLSRGPIAFPLPSFLFFTGVIVAYLIMDSNRLHMYRYNQYSTIPKSIQKKR